MWVTRNNLLRPEHISFSKTEAARLELPEKCPQVGPIPDDVIEWWEEDEDPHNRVKGDPARSLFSLHDEEWFYCEVCGRNLRRYTEKDQRTIAMFDVEEEE